MNQRFHDPYEGMTDEEIEEEALRLFDRPETTITLTISQDLYDEIKALAARRAGEPVHQLAVHALNLGLRQIQAETDRTAS
jgi:hypothetical protein